MLKHFTCTQFTFVAFGCFLCVHVHIHISLHVSKISTPCFSKLMRYSLVFQLIREFQGFVEHNKEDLHRVLSRVVRLEIQLLFFCNASS